MISRATGRPSRVLLTRSREGNVELSAKLRSIGFDPIALDVLEVVPAENWGPIDQKLMMVDNYDWLVFTSATGARLFSDRMRILKMKPRSVRTRIAVVGAKTAAALEEKGWKADFIPSTFLTEKLAEEITPAGKVLLLRSDLANDSLAGRLRERGFEVDEFALYSTRRRFLASADPVKNAELVIFGSPSAVDALCSQLPDAVLSGLLKKVAACIGPVTAAAARNRGFTRIISCTSEHTFDSLLEEIWRAYSFG